MATNIETVDTIIDKLVGDRKDAIVKLRNIVSAAMPIGFEECVSYGMISYVVPHSLYPAGYHCKPQLPLPFISFASLKNQVSFHHMGIYADASLLQWFENEYAKLPNTKLDMGKGCIRFKKINEIPYQLIEDLCKKITVEQWVFLYEKAFIKPK
jgi:uncharacterized protein YdhG (YjbR/CyaY superfamily)